MKPKKYPDLGDDIQAQGKWKEFWQIVYLPKVPSRGSFIEGPFATQELGLASLRTVSESHQWFLVKVRVIDEVKE